MSATDMCVACVLWVFDMYRNNDMCNAPRTPHMYYYIRITHVVQYPGTVLSVSF